MLEHLIEHSDPSSQRPKVSQRNMATRDPTSATPSTMSRMTMTDTPVQMVPAYGPDESSTLDDLSSGASINDIDIDPNYNPSEMISFDSDSGMIAQPGSFDFNHYTAPKRDISLKGAQKEQAPLQLNDTQFRDIPAFNDDGTLHKKPSESPTAPRSSSSGPRKRIHQKPFVQHPLPSKIETRYQNPSSLVPMNEGREDFQVSDDFIPEIIPAAESAASITSDPKLQLELSTLRETVQNVCEQQALLAHEVTEIRHIKSQSQACRKLEEGQTRTAKMVNQIPAKVKATEEKSNKGSNFKAEVKINTSAQKSGSSVALVDFNAPLSPKLKKMLADYFGVGNKEEEHPIPDNNAEAPKKTPRSSTKGTTPESVKAQTTLIELLAWTRIDCFRLGLFVGALGVIMGVIVAPEIPPGDEGQCWAGFLIMALCIWLVLERWIDNMGVRENMIKYPERYDR